MIPTNRPMIPARNDRDGQMHTHTDPHIVMQCQFGSMAPDNRNFPINLR